MPVVMKKTSPKELPAAYKEKKAVVVVPPEVDDSVVLTDRQVAAAVIDKFIQKFTVNDEDIRAIAGQGVTASRCERLKKIVELMIMKLRDPYVRTLTKRGYYNG